MPGFSDPIEKEILGAYFTGAALTSPSTLHIALCTSAPSDNSDVINEVTYSAYARQPIAQAGWTVDPAADDPSYAYNNGEITFPTATDNGGTATHWALMTAPTGGSLIFSGDVPQPVGGLAISNGIQPKIDIGAMRAQLGG